MIVATGPGCEQKSRNGEIFAAETSQVRASSSMVDFNYCKFLTWLMMDFVTGTCCQNG
ncbi:MAG: hypothetical protein ABSG35_16815 [Syntrophobacteraceae bacterium]|jgi:hypothetical protein